MFRRKPEKLKEHQSINLGKYLRSKTALEDLYKLRNRLHKLLMHRGLSKKSLRSVARQFFEIIKILKDSKFDPLISLAKTLKSWQLEILTMLRFNRSNGITEGFHNKMEKITRIGYGFRNFNNYKQRVMLKCG